MAKIRRAAAKAAKDKVKAKGKGRVTKGVLKGSIPTSSDAQVSGDSSSDVPWSYEDAYGMIRLTSSQIHRIQLLLVQIHVHRQAGRLLVHVLRGSDVELKSPQSKSTMRKVGAKKMTISMSKRYLGNQAMILNRPTNRILNHQSPI